MSCDALAGFDVPGNYDSLNGFGDDRPDGLTIRGLHEIGTMKDAVLAHSGTPDRWVRDSARSEPIDFTESPNVPDHRRGRVAAPSECIRWLGIGAPKN